MAVASSNPVRDISENADDLVYGAANLKRMSCRPLHKIGPNHVREVDASQPQLHVHQRLGHVSVDELWVFERVGDGENQMSGAGFHPPKGHRDAHQFGDLPQMRAALDKSLRFWNRVDVRVSARRPEYGQAETGEDARELQRAMVLCSRTIDLVSLAKPKTPRQGQCVRLRSSFKDLADKSIDHKQGPPPEAVVDAPIACLLLRNPSTTTLGSPDSRLAPCGRAFRSGLPGGGGPPSGA